jgi:RHS repeat-associated protein
MQHPAVERLSDFKLSTGVKSPLTHFTGKELDEETGFYYYGARYLNPKTSMWISADPAMEDYVPSAPVNEEAKKHNEKLPGMGGVFNYVNMHMYHYAGNNPIKYTDPNGRENKKALDWMKKNLTGIPEGYWYFPPGDKNGKTHPFVYDQIPDQLHCYQAVYCAYVNAGKLFSKMPPSRNDAIAWFKNGGVIPGTAITKSFVTDITKGEMGDIVFMGESGNMEGHAVLLVGIQLLNSNTIELTTYGAYSPSGDIGPEIMTFEKNSRGEWMNTSHGDYNYVFRGYGQFSE